MYGVSPSAIFGHQLLGLFKNEKTGALKQSLRQCWLLPSDCRGGELKAPAMYVSKILDEICCCDGAFRTKLDETEVTVVISEIREEV